MKKLNLSTKQIDKFAGMWVAIDHRHEKIIAAGKTLRDIAIFVSGKIGNEKDVRASAFLVPKKGEGPYILIIKS